MISAGMLFLCAIGLGWTVGVKDKPESHRWPGESLDHFVDRTEATVRASIVAMQSEEVPNERRKAYATQARA